MAPLLLGDLNDDVLLCIIDAIAEVDFDETAAKTTFGGFAPRTLMAFSSTCHRFRHYAAKALFTGLFSDGRPLSMFETILESDLLPQHARALAINWIHIPAFEFLAADTLVTRSLQRLDQLTSLYLGMPEMDEETHLNWAPAIDLPNLIELHTDHLGMKLAKQCPKLARIHLHRKLVPKLIPAEGLRESYYYADMCSPVPSLQHLHPEAKIEYLVLAFWELNDESFDEIATQMPDLQHLEISENFTPWSCRVENFLNSLAKCQKLEILAVSRPRFKTYTIRRHDAHLKDFRFLRHCELLGELVFKACPSVVNVGFQPSHGEWDWLYGDRDWEGTLEDMEWGLFHSHDKLAEDHEAMEDEVWEEVLTPHFASEQWSADRAMTGATEFDFKWAGYRQ